MYKYIILTDDWHRPLSYFGRKVYQCDDFFVNIDNKCIANDVMKKNSVDNVITRFIVLI